MELIHRRDIIKGILDRWNEQYPDDNYQFFDGSLVGPIRAKLTALDLKKCSPKDVDRVVGKETGWAENECDECGKDVPMLVHLGHEPGYGARYWRICRACLEKALKAVTITKPKL